VSESAELAKGFKGGRYWQDAQREPLAALASRALVRRDQDAILFDHEGR